MGIKALVTDLLWAATRRKGWIARRIDSLCADYRAAFADMSYDIRRNGESSLVRRLSKLQPKVIFDVGANQGDWSKLVLAECASVELHAFELSPQTFLALKQALSATSARLNAFGLSDTTGPIEFRDYGDGSPISTIVDSSFHSSLQHRKSAARVFAGDEYCDREGLRSIDLLKIDVEGAELRVLRGFSRMLDGKRIRCIQFEYGFANGDDHALMRDFHQFLEPRGYVIGRLWSRGVAFGPFSYRENQFDSGPNYVAIRADDSECREILEALA